MNIFFDLDGTLTDISMRHYTVYRKSVEHFSGYPLEKELYWAEKRKNTRWKQLLAMSGLDNEHVFLDYFIQLIEHPDYLRMDTLFTGSLHVLKETSVQHELYLVSLRRNQQNLIDQLDGFGIKGYFQVVMSGHSDTIEGTLNKKAEVISLEGLNHSPAIIIGDTEADIATGRSLGIPSVAVTTGIRDRQFLSNLHPDHLIDSIEKVLSILR